MSRRKSPPPVTRPTGWRRAAELLKDLVIAALLCLGIFLVSRTQLVRHFGGLVSPLVPTPEPAAEAVSYGVVPVGMAVRNGLGLYGVSYDEAAVGRTWDRFAPLIGEALSTAGEAEVISRLRWQALLESPGVYCVFQGSPALAAMQDWPEIGAEPAGAAQALVLARSGEELWLAWRDGETFFRAQAQPVYGSSLDAALEEFRPNGASFAYLLARSDPAYSALDPYVLASMSTPQPGVYEAASPDLTAAGELEKLLRALEFLSGAESAYETAEGLTVAENGDRLQVTAGGEVSFRAGDETRFAVGRERWTGSVREAVQRSWEVLEQCAAPWKDAGSYTLTAVEDSPDGLEVCFSWRLGGIPVKTGAEDRCARFVIREGRIYSFNLSLRTYTAAGETWTVPGDRLAAAALRSLPAGKGNMILCYRDNGGGVPAVSWMVEE